MCSTADGVAGHDAEEDLDPVQPGPAGLGDGSGNLLILPLSTFRPGFIDWVSQDIALRQNISWPTADDADLLHAECDARITRRRVSTL